MGAFSIWHWLIVLAVVVLVFGTKKLRNLGGDLGTAVKGFKKGMAESEPEHIQPAPQVNNQTIESETKEDTHTKV